MKLKSIVFIALLFITFNGCSGLNFSQLSPDAKNFHPKTIAVLPATVGEYEASRDVIDGVVSKKLTKSGWFTNVTDAQTIKTQLTSSPELSADVQAYIQKMNTLGISDSVLAGKLRESLKANALFMTYVTSWGYGRLDGNKIGRVGLGVKLIDASKGTVIWKANHELITEYTFFAPKLPKMAEEVLAVLLKEMPH